MSKSARPEIRKSTSRLRAAVRSLIKPLQKLPDEPSAEVIDREYIEGETADEIGEISQMTDIPDKAQRHPRQRPH